MGGAAKLALSSAPLFPRSRARHSRCSQSCRLVNLAGCGGGWKSPPGACCSGNLVGWTVKEVGAHRHQGRSSRKEMGRAWFLAKRCMPCCDVRCRSCRATCPKIPDYRVGPGSLVGTTPSCLATVFRAACRPCPFRPQLPTCSAPTRRPNTHLPASKVSTHEKKLVQGPRVRVSRLN